MERKTQYTDGRFSSKRPTEAEFTTKNQAIVSKTRPPVRRLNEVRNSKQKLMCPICITTLALAAAGASASGGLATFIVRKPQSKTSSKKHRPKETENP